MQVNNFTVLESIHGRFIVNRHCSFQIDYLAKFGHTHIESELNQIFQILDKLPDGCTIVDGGTNIGFFSIPVAQYVKNRNINVVGFEPQRMLFSALSGSIALNDLKNCWVHNLALSSSPGTVTLPEVNYGVQMDYGMVQVTHNDKPVTEPLGLRDRIVNAVTIDSMELPEVKFIKLDVEGYECEALNGAKECIRKHRPYIWVEYFIIGHQTIIDCLNNIAPGYKYFIADQQNMVCMPE